MANTKISALTAATTPVAGTEVLPIVQSGTTKQVSIANLTAGRAISATQLTLTTGNLIVASGQGIDFSATPGTGTSELLADYEEGTWTPVYGGFTFGGTTTTTNAKYTKIGRCVYVTFTVSDSVSIVCTTGVSFITGLPFVVGGSSTTTTVNENTGASIGVGLVYISGNNLFLPTFTAGAGQVINTSFFYFV